MRCLMTTLCLLLAVGGMAPASAGAPPAPAAERTPQYPMDPGRIAGVPLQLFAGDDARRALDLLALDRVPDAMRLLKDALRKNPNDLVAWLGMMQTDPRQWPAEIKRQQGLIKGPGPASAQARFKAGVLLFYQWGQEPEPAALAETEPPIPGRQLLQEAWKDAPSVVVGMALLDTYLHNDPKASAAIVDRIVLDLAGPETQKALRAAEQAHWLGAPLPAPRIAATNLRALLGVVRRARGEAGERPRSRVKQADGAVTFVLDPVPPEMQQKAKALQAWREAIETELRRIDPTYSPIP